MSSFIESMLLGIGTALLGKREVNEILIDRIVRRGRNRPHPWSTRESYISWDGLTDRTFNARLLRADPYPPAEARGTRKPPLADVEALFAPVGGAQRLCPKSTCLFPAFAQYLTDGFIRTHVFNDPSRDDRRRTTSNHEIDMSPLYGRTREQTTKLRLLSNDTDRKGRLLSQNIPGAGEFPLFLYKADGSLADHFVDADGRCVLDEPLGLSRVPPVLKPSLFAVGGDRANATAQVAMMNVLFLREHNRLALETERANPGWDDERVFQVTRNAMIVMFIKIVVEDYINHINTSGFRFIADPEVAWGARWNRPNWMTAEFSLLYRWHSLVPARMQVAGGDIGSETLLFNNTPLLQRGLADMFVDMSANRATSLDLQNTAPFLSAFESRAIQQARSLDIAPYAAYRRCMSFEAPKSFGRLVGTSDDPAERDRRRALAERLRDLYGTVENVEFYVGLFAEPNPENAPLSDLLTAMVAMDAFSQALTNPLLSRHIYGNEENRAIAFGAPGWNAITTTRSLRDVLDRNTGGTLGARFVGFTRQGWERD